MSTTTTATPTTTAISIRLRIWLEGSSILRILMMAIWVTTWYQVLMGERVRWGVAFFAMTAAVGVSFYLTRLFSRLELAPARARLFFILWLAAILILSLQTMVLAVNAAEGGSIVEDLVESVQVFAVDFGIIVHLVVVILLAWRGIVLAQSAMDQGEAVGSFQTGIFAFLLYGFVFGSTLPARSFFPVYAFLLVSLVGLATARITDLAAARGGRLPGSFLNWWLPILAAAAVVVAVALFSGWLVGSQVSYLAVAILAVFVITVFIFSVLVALPILIIVYLAMPWLQKMFGEGLELMAIQNPNEIADQIFGEDLDEIARSMTGIDQSYMILLGILLIALIIVVVVSLRARTQRRQFAIQMDDANSIVPTRRPGGWQPGDLRLPGSFGRTSRFFAAARIRRVYWELMRLGNQLGRPRPPSVTPLEYLSLLDSVFPGEQENLRMVTRAYLQVRYGETPESEAEVRQVLDAWEEIRKVGRKIIREQRKERGQARSA